MPNGLGAARARRVNKVRPAAVLSPNPSERALRHSQSLMEAAHLQAPDPHAILSGRTQADVTDTPSTAPTDSLDWQTWSLVVFVCAIPFFISNMDKNVFSVALNPMTTDLLWSHDTTGFCSSAFFVGFLLMQIPAGILAVKLGGKRLLPLAVAFWSLATMLHPAAAYTSSYLLMVARVLLGAGEGAAPSAVMHIITTHVKKVDRQKAIGIAFSAFPLGSVFTLAVCPLIIAEHGWPAPYVWAGAIGLLWCMAFHFVLGGHDEKGEGAGADSKELTIPLWALLKCEPLRPLCVTHFCYSWVHYLAITFLPYYFADHFGLKLDLASYMTVWPSLACVVVSMGAGVLGEYLTARGWSVTKIRKVAQGAGFAIPSALFAILAWGCAHENPTPFDANTSTAIITAALGISNLSSVGLYCSHQDLSPKYAAAMLSVTNTFGGLAGAVALPVGMSILSATESYSLAMWTPCALAFAVGLMAFTGCSSHEPVDLDDPELNRPPEWVQRQWDRALPARLAFAGAVGRARLAAEGVQARLGLPVSITSASSAPTATPGSASCSASSGLEESTPSAVGSLFDSSVPLADTMPALQPSPASEQPEQVNGWRRQLATLPSAARTGTRGVGKVIKTVFHMR